MTPRARKYVRDIRQTWDWPRVVRTAGENETAYLGRVMSIFPSGKYYAPFASSNVDGDCHICKGKGSTGNRKAAPLLEAGARAAREELTRKNGAANKLFHQWSPEDRRMAAHLDGEMAKYGPRRTCLACAGTGSLSAARDSDFREALEAVAAEYNGVITEGQGDPTEVHFQLNEEE